jgi:hypothetical protein
MESAFNVLVGFSLAGLAARVYVHRYPTESRGDAVSGFDDGI